MKLALTPKLIGQRLADLPAAMPDLQLLILFGSAVKGRVEAALDINESETIEDAKVLESIGTLWGVYPRYVQAVETYLSKLGL